jgi:DNA-binding XRE family transcriptional regulator
MQAQKYTHVGCVAFGAFLISWRVVRPAPEQLKLIGAAIRDYRRQAGLTQERLAEKADLHPVYIGKVERGEQWISLHALLRVAEALGVPAGDILRDV